MSHPSPRRRHSTESPSGSPLPDSPNQRSPSSSFQMPEPQSKIPLGLHPVASDHLPRSVRLPNRRCSSPPARSKERRSSSLSRSPCLLPIQGRGASSGAPPVRFLCSAPASSRASPPSRRRRAPPPGRRPLPAPRAPSFLFFPVLTPHHLLPLASLYRKPPGRRRHGWVSPAPSRKPLHRPDHLRPRDSPASSSPPLVLRSRPPWPPAPPVRLPRELQRRHASTAQIRRRTILEPRQVPRTAAPSHIAPPHLDPT